MATRRVLVALALLPALLGAAPVRAQAALPEFCVAQPASGSDERSYKARARGAYCDGIVFVPHARKSGLLPILAVETGPVDEQVSGETVVVLGSATAGAVSVQGLPLDDGVNYRLDARLAAGTRLQLGDDSGLAHIDGLTFSDLGWLAWVDSAQGVVYRPRLAPRLSAREIEITVRPTMRSAYVVYAVYDAAGTELLGPREAASDVEPKTNVTVTVPGQGPSPIRVSVMAIGSGKKRETANLWIERRGAADGG